MRGALWRMCDRNCARRCGRDAAARAQTLSDNLNYKAVRGRGRRLRSGTIFAAPLRARAATRLAVRNRLPDSGEPGVRPSRKQRPLAVISTAVCGSPATPAGDPQTAVEM